MLNTLSDRVRIVPSSLLEVVTPLSIISGLNRSVVTGLSDSGACLACEVCSLSNNCDTGSSSTCVTCVANCSATPDATPGEADKAA